MPLVLAVLIIVVIFLNAKDSAKWNAKQSALHEDWRRKTNARLEQKIMDSYMKHGYSADEAFRKSYDDMIAMGYDPCIPRDAYKKNSSSCWKLGAGGPQRFDSLWVKQRRDEAKSEWQQIHPDVHISEASPEEIDRLTYKNFPTTEYAYLHDIKRSASKASAEPVGTFIIYPGLGTCEILAHNWIGDGAAGGTYTLKVLKTGQIVTYVKIGDSKIRKQGQ